MQRLQLGLGPPTGATNFNTTNQLQRVYFQYTGTTTANIYHLELTNGGVGSS